MVHHNQFEYIPKCKDKECDKLVENAWEILQNKAEKEFGRGSENYDNGALNRAQYGYDLYPIPITSKQLELISDILEKNPLFQKRSADDEWKTIETQIKSKFNGDLKLYWKKEEHKPWSLRNIDTFAKFNKLYTKYLENKYKDYEPPAEVKDIYKWVITHPSRTNGWGWNATRTYGCGIDSKGEDYEKPFCAFMVKNKTKDIKINTSKTIQYEKNELSEKETIPYYTWNGLCHSEPSTKNSIGYSFMNYNISHYNVSMKFDSLANAKLWLADNALKCDIEQTSLEKLKLSQRFKLKTQTVEKEVPHIAVHFIGDIDT